MQKIFLLTIMSASTALALPTVSNVTCTQDPETRRVTVGYVVSGGSAVVTPVFTADGQVIPVECVRDLDGDVGTVVTNRAAPYMFTWNPDFDYVAHADSLDVALTAWDANDPPPYLVVRLDIANSFRFYASTNAIPDGIQHRRYKTDFLVMRKIPAAGQTFRMGSFPAVGNYRAEKGSRDQNFGETDAEVPHAVTLSRNYYMGIYEVTQKQFLRIYGYGSGEFSYLPQSELHPAEKIIYNTLRGSTDQGVNWPSTGSNVASGSVIGLVRAKTGIDTFDLPTEAQWEFACRAGTTSALNSGKELDYSNMWAANGPSDCPAASEVGWWLGNAAMVTNAELGVSVKCTHPVGEKPPNAFGLYDMHGNVREWCLDWYAHGADYSDGSAEVDPQGPSNYVTYARRVLRGGSWNEYAPAVRSASRGRMGPHDYTSGNLHGFRLTCRTDFVR